MPKELIERLRQEPDLTAVMFEIAACWVKRYYPSSDYAALVVTTGEESRVNRLTLTSSDSFSDHQSGQAAIQHESR